MINTIRECGAYEYDENARVKKLARNGSNMQRLMNLQEIVVEDIVNIELNDVPVDKLSPGQRSSAMLPLIALAEKDVPLVIDQPEDNLDNKLIGDVLTDILARLKEKRQMIVCTHNPNIVVLGDAEQVVIMKDLSSDRVMVERQGSVDVEEVVESIIDIMEGGEEAFINREKRYGLK